MKEIKYKILLLDYKDRKKNSIIKDDTDEESDEGKTKNNYNTNKHFLCFYFSPHSGVYS